MVGVVVVAFERFAQLRGRDLAVRRRQGQHLVPAVLDSAGLMDVNVARFGA